MLPILRSQSKLRGLDRLPSTGLWMLPEEPCSLQRHNGTRGFGSCAE